MRAPSALFLSLSLLAASCSGLPGAAGYTAEAVGEKLVRDETAPLRERLDRLDKGQTDLFGGQTALFRQLASLRRMLEADRKAMYRAHSESDKLHQKWGREIARLKEQPKQTGAAVHN